MSEKLRRALTVYSTALASLMRRLDLRETLIEAEEMRPLEWLEVTDIERDERGDLVSMRVRRVDASEGEVRRGAIRMRGAAERDAYRRGAEEMRDRAADLCFALGYGSDWPSEAEQAAAQAYATAGGEIRALSIEPPDEGG